MFAVEVEDKRFEEYYTCRQVGIEFLKGYLAMSLDFGHLTFDFRNNTHYYVLKLRNEI